MKNILLIISLAGGITLSAQNSGTAVETRDQVKTEAPGSTVKTQSKDTSDEVLTFAAIMPEYPGGNEAMINYIQQNIKYPKDGRDSAITGTVYVQFVVRRDGYVSDVTVARGIKGYPSFGAEAVRVVSAMPKWEPAEMNDKPVSVKMTIPIRFSLD